jgi:hypothetical protein
MKVFLIAAASAVAIIALAALYIKFLPQCDARSPDGFRLGNVRMFGCDRPRR